MILHPQTARDYDHIVARPPHALLIAGNEGAGKSALALSITQKLLSKTSLDEDSSFRRFIPIKGSIGIEQVRELQKFLHLKTTGQQAIRRVIIIEQAHTMTHEAQNALLKVLEEPPADTVIILTAIRSKHILPTIYSRVQQLTVKSPSLEQSKEHYMKNGHTSVAIEKAYALSNGQQGLLAALLEQDSDHDLVTAINLAKSILAKSKFERVTIVDELSKQKNALPQLLQALKRIAYSGLDQAAAQSKDAQSRKWHAVLASVHETESLLPHNPNAKLLLTDLMLKI
jgi:DNA polymerase III subunit delta'